MVPLKIIGLFTFSNGVNQSQQAFDVACSPLWWSGSTFMWLDGTLKNPPINTLLSQNMINKSTKNNQQEQNF